MREIVDDALRMLTDKREFALVTLVRRSGSTPRAAGAEMLVRRDGSIAGTIGGGGLELTMMKAAAEALEARRSQTTSLALSGTDLTSEEKMVCGGSAEILITYVPVGDRELLEVCSAIRATTAAQRRAWLFTIMPAEDGGAVEHCLLGEDDSVVGAQPCEPKTLRAAVGKIGVHGSAQLADGREVLVEPLEVPATAVICGAGHVGQALAPVAQGAGFRVVVVDDREEFTDRERSRARTSSSPRSTDRSSASAWESTRTSSS